MFRSDLFFRDNFRPGVRHIFDGTTGSGKTFTVISLMQHLIRGEIDTGTKVVAITNVVMVKREHGRLVQGYPRGVYPMRSFAEMMRLVGDLLREHGMGRITILMVLDEAQNFMLADQNAARENLALVKFMANIRKFGICTVFMTPTRKNLAPKIRNFADDPSSPGNLNVYWHKDLRAAEILVGRGMARDTAIVQMSSEEEPFPIVVAPGSWTKPLDRLEEGEYGYDALSAADFEMGSNAHGIQFDIKRFLNRCSGVASFEIPQAIGDFFEAWDREGASGEDETDPAVRIRNDVRLAALLVGKEGWSVARAARLLGYEERQFRRYCQRYGPTADASQRGGDIGHAEGDMYRLNGEEATEGRSFV